MTTTMITRIKMTTLVRVTVLKLKASLVKVIMMMAIMKMKTYEDDENNQDSERGRY